MYKEIEIRLQIYVIIADVYCSVFFSCTVLYKQIKHLNTRIAVLPVSCMTVRLGLCHIKWKRQIKGVGKESAYGNIWTSEG